MPVCLCAVCCVSLGIGHWGGSPVLPKSEGSNRHNVCRVWGEYSSQIGGYR